MFEYLMPLLVMRSYPGTLLDETYQRGRAAADTVRRAARRAMGHLRIRVQHAGPGEELPVSRLRCAGTRPQARPRPTTWSSRRMRRILAAPLAPREVLDNLERLRREGMAGRYGFYEAIDYTLRTPAAQITRAAWCCAPGWRTTRA